MSPLAAKITGLCSSLMEDSSKLDMIVSKGFRHFDKDSSGFIESHEITGAVQHILTLARLPQVPVHVLDGVFLKVAGADMRLSKDEFLQLFHKLLAKIKGNPDPVVAAAAEAGYTAE